jgi:putative nucleotidyltransferase with HDIG domain
MEQSIRLRGLLGIVKGKSWQSDNLLRVGRFDTSEIVLDDESVSRRHAEIRHTETGWWVRDLNSKTGTYVNGVRLTKEGCQLHSRDVVQFGKIGLIVDLPENISSNQTSDSDRMEVETVNSSSWEEGFARLLEDRNHSPRAGDQLMALLRAGHHAVNTNSEEELLHRILQDSVAVLDAQRGVIVLADSLDGSLRLRALVNGRNEPPGRFPYSRKMAQQCFTWGESILCCSVEDHPELKSQPSIAEGQMASILCVLLKTSRKRLGVLHLDRSYGQKPFTTEDLHLAEALAAYVALAIESAQSLRQQQDLFLHTSTILAQSIELRDEYTGGHSARVTNYALLLAQELKLSNEDMDLLRVGTPLHDLGKIGIDDAILRKPDRLTPEEYAIMQTHTVQGAAILSTIPNAHTVIPIVRSHHERWDGKGYPDRLAGEAIPLLARIVAVADVFDSMTSHPPYRKERLTPEFAFEEIRKMTGTQFDPTCAQAFLKIEKQIIESMNSNRMEFFYR